MRRYRVTGTPTYLVIGSTGEVLHRKTFGMPDKGAVREAVGKH